MDDVNELEEFPQISWTRPGVLWWARRNTRMDAEETEHNIHEYMLRDVSWLAAVDWP